MIARWLFGDQREPEQCRNFQSFALGDEPGAAILELECGLEPRHRGPHSLYVYGANFRWI